MCVCVCVCTCVYVCVVGVYVKGKSAVTTGSLYGPIDKCKN